MGKAKKTKKAGEECPGKKSKMAVTCDLSGPHGAGGSGLVWFIEQVSDGTSSNNSTTKRNA